MFKLKFLLIITSACLIFNIKPVFALEIPYSLEVKLSKLDYLEEDRVSLWLSWKPLFRASEYKLYTFNGDKPLLAGKVSSPQANLTFSRYAPFFKMSVSAYANNQEIGQSTLLDITWERILPKPPQNLKIEKTETKGNQTQAFLSWDQALGAQKYYIYIVSPQKQSLGELTVNQTVLTYDKYGDSFQIAVSSFNETGESSLSNILEVKREYYKPSSVPGIPQNFHLDSRETLTAEKKIKLNFKWDKVTDAGKYDFYIINGIIPQKIGDVQSNDISLFVPQDFYTFVVLIKAANELGDSDFGLRITIPGKEIPLGGTTALPMPSPSSSPEPLSSAEAQKVMTDVQKEVSQNIKDFTIKENKPAEDIKLAYSDPTPSPSPLPSKSPTVDLLMDKSKAGVFSKIFLAVKSLYLTIRDRFFKNI